jgi:hypothetical protein
LSGCTFLHWHWIPWNRPYSRNILYYTHVNNTYKNTQESLMYVNEEITQHIFFYFIESLFLLFWVILRCCFSNGSEQASWIFVITLWRLVGLFIKKNCLNTTIIHRWIGLLLKILLLKKLFSLQHELFWLIISCSLRDPHSIETAFFLYRYIITVISVPSWWSSWIQTGKTVLRLYKKKLGNSLVKVSQSLISLRSLK